MRPSREISPCPAGSDSGSTTTVVARRVLQLRDEGLEAAGIGGDRRRLVVDDDRVLRAERREVPAELVAHLLRGRALRLPARARQRARQRQRERRGRERDHEAR